MCVIVAPLVEDVHGAIRHYKARDLSWYLQDPESLDISDPETGYRPLMTALIWNKPKHFRMLLLRGSDPDLTDRVGNTSLHVAAQINAPRRVLELLKAGANPQAQNAQHKTFQTYLFMTPEAQLSARNRKDRAAVIAWLNEHGVKVEIEESGE
jgi:uncharacterized protein